MNRSAAKVQYCPVNVMVLWVRFPRSEMIHYNFPLFGNKAKSDATNGGKWWRETECVNTRFLEPRGFDLPNLQ